MLLVGETRNDKDDDLLVYSASFAVKKVTLTYYTSWVPLLNWSYMLQRRKPILLIWAPAKPIGFNEVLGALLGQKPENKGAFSLMTNMSSCPECLD